MLPAGSTRTEYVDLEVLGINLQLNLLCLGQHRDSHRRSVDAALCLGLGHPLDPMHPAFEFQAGIDPIPVKREANLLITAQLGLIRTQNLARPAPALGVHTVHPIERTRKECRFIPASAPADFNNDILFIVGVLRQQENPQLLRGGFDLVTAGVKLLLRQFTQFFVQSALPQHLPRFLKRLLRLAVFLVFFYDRGQTLIFFHQGGIQLLIVGHIRLHQLVVDLVIPRCDRFQSV